MMLSLVSNMLNNSKRRPHRPDLVKKKQQLLESYAFFWNLKDYSVKQVGAMPREGQSLPKPPAIFVG